MARYERDLVVIGAGSGGVRASRVAAALGARVTLVESGPLGGTCVNAGCVPKKLYVIAAGHGAALEDAPANGWRVAVEGFHWERLREGARAEVARLNGVYERLLERVGVELVRGRGRLVSDHEVEVDGRRIGARHVVLATGARPWRPPIPGAELAWTSDDVFGLPELPRRVVVVGGGYIAVEFAGIFARLGCATTLAYRGPRLLKRFDHDIGEHLAGLLRAAGVELHLDAPCEAIRRREDGDLEVLLGDGRTLRCDGVLLATGRRAATEGLGLEQVGVRTRRSGAIDVDSAFRTSVPGVYAVGDAIGRVQLTPVALAEGEALARALLGGRPPRVDYHDIPTAVFTLPPVGTVGLSEAAARDRLDEVDVYRAVFQPMTHALSGRREPVLVKVIVDAATDRVRGFHMVGPAAGEIVQGLAVALKAGVTKARLDATLGIHPTIAEEFVTLREPVRRVSGRG